ncbi:MAG: mycofactocin biosynthesis peptidyl-dipeptidase MftE [Acidimicrobiales bacterium]|nr:mycofactocin biosynthesis peptidyl-dipeptidase MftE [Acidimicrobiales bacterium]
MAALAWPDVASRSAGSVLAVPVGSTEQHGPHLPLSTDTDIALALSERLAAARPEVLVAPPVSYGSSGEHAGFAGTLSIGAEALEAVLVELGRSAEGFGGVLFVSTHGGNARPVRRAVGVLVSEGRQVAAWSPPPGVDAHAGFTETSVMMAAAPSLVRSEAAEPGCLEPLDALMPALVASGLGAVSANGVLGDPRRASEAAGAQLLDEWAADLVSALGVARERWS